MATAATPALAEPSLRERQWYLDFLKVPEAQHITTGKGVLVAIVDSGVDATHPDIAGQVEAGTDLTTSGGNSAADVTGHGTHMAGIIAAKGGPGGKVLGVAPASRILPIRVLVNDASGATDRAIASGIKAAVDRGASVVNLSLGGGVTQPIQREAIAYALAHDAVVVASAGNTARGDAGVISPANIPGVVAVTGIDRLGQFSAKSVSGPQAVVAAPAEDIAGIDSRMAPKATGYSSGTGTSDAAAIVSGVVALIRSKYPQLDAANVINRLIRTADDAGPPGRDPQYGFGRVNVLRALTAEVPPVTANPLGDPAGVPAPAATVPAAAANNEPVRTPDAAAGPGPSGPLQTLFNIAIFVVVIGGIVGGVGLLVRMLRGGNRKGTDAERPPPQQSSSPPSV